jgi:signal peptidase II
MKGRTLAAYALLVLAAVAADQFVKAWAEASLPLHEQVDVIPFLALYRTQNTGIAFSMFSGMGDTGLILLTLAVTTFIGYLAIRTQPADAWARLGFALIIGGALGNLIDRVFHGYVIDYVLFHTPTWSFAIFNLADAFISVGAAFVILQEALNWRRERTGSR